MIIGNLNMVPITILKCVPYTIKCSWVSCKIAKGCRWTEVITNKTIRICYELNIPHNATYSVSCRVVLQIFIYIYIYVYANIEIHKDIDEEYYTVKKILLTAKQDERFSSHFRQTGLDSSELTGFHKK